MPSEAPGASERSPDESPAESPQEPQEPSEQRKPTPGQPDETASPPPHARAEKAFPIAGVGASAGGLEALGELFAAMPSDTGMAFIVVTHQHPGHATMLPSLLGKKTALPVVEAADGMPVEPNRVYVGLPGGQLAIGDGTLHRSETDSPEPPHLPIDHFFRSLAFDQKERAIGIILSGTGRDGTLGLKAIKAESGMAMVQDARSARYAGMPSSAVGTGLADFVLPPAEMPEQLIAYARGPYLAMPPPDGRREVSTEPMQRIFMLLRSRTGHDFSSYKISTVQRRIERRMNLHQVEGPGQYARLLQENQREVEALFKELLISVTSFFRDPEAWEALAVALRARLKSRPVEEGFRAWVPGCATGEEVYSLAILLREIADGLNRPLEVQLFGTDLDAQAIDKARTGHYPDGIAVDVTPRRLERWLTRGDDGYRIRKEIREMAVFSVQNVLKHPPFTKLDLIACRNLLIYLNSDPQKKLLPLFHYALRADGLLFLGPSESIGSFGELYEPVDKKWKIYRRRESTRAIHTMLELHGEPPARPAPKSEGAPSPPARDSHIARHVERLLIARFAPPSVVIDECGDLVFIHGRTGAYLEPAAGQPRLNIHEMAREGLQGAVAGALREAAQREREARQQAVRVRTNGDYVYIDLAVSPIAEPEALRGRFLVTFRPCPEPAELAKPKGAAARARESRRVEQLEQELRYTKESLQTTIEELETSNEELKSTNEELQSTNEELQSSNEELETSKEEMQSLNEELTTVNAELHAKIEELSRANDDMQNLLNSTEIATIFLDCDLHIKRYTDQARHLVSLIDTDVGRPLADLASSLRYDALVEDSREVLRTLVFKEAEVQTKQGQWYLMRIMPYRTADNVIDGLVLTFVDVNAVKRAEQDLAVAKERLAADLEAMNRLHEIGIRFLRGEAMETILQQVLDAAIVIGQADMGYIQTLESSSGSLPGVVERGCTGPCLELWGHLRRGQAPPDQALRRGERVDIEDIATSRALAETATQTALMQAGIRRISVLPLMSRSDRLLGILAMHFKRRDGLDEHTQRLLDPLLRQMVEFFEHAQSGRGHGSQRDPGALE